MLTAIVLINADVDRIPEVAEAIADAVEKEKKHVILPKRIAAMAYLTETPRRVSELMLTGIDQDSD